MIVSFGSKDTRLIWEGKAVMSIPIEIQKTGRRKLRILNNSQSIIDLKISPSNRLEKLGGKMKNDYSIRINDQWRIIFIWKDNSSFDVEMIDDHK